MCHDIASTCEACGNAPADIIAEPPPGKAGYSPHLWLCARCYLIRGKAA